MRDAIFSLSLAFAALVSGHAASAAAEAPALLVPQPDPAPAIRPYLTSPTSATVAAEALRARIKYVFILYQENRSFDAYFGGFPGARGLYSAPAAMTPGFFQPIVKPDGGMATIHPFRLGPADFAADLDDMDHSHPILVEKMHISEGSAAMDRFALAEEMKYVKPGEKP